MANCNLCQSWIFTPTYTSDAKYDSLCDHCKVDLGYRDPLSKEELKLLRDRKKRLYELSKEYDTYIETCLDLPDE